MDLDSLEKIISTNRFNGVFHLAAQSHPPTGFLDPLGTLKTNLIGSANLFYACPPNLKICVVSTSEVYGNSGADGRLLKETDPLAPSNPYATGKAAMDLHFQERMKNGYNTGFITRAFSHTGARRGKTFSISSDAYQIAGFMKHFEVQHHPFGKQPKDWLYKLKVGNLETVRCVLSVEDVVNAYVLLMYNPKSNGEIFNVCGDTPLKMQFFTDKLIELSGLQIEKVIDEKLYRPIDIQYQHGDVSKLRELTYWSLSVPIEKTLTDLLNYWVKKLG